MYEFERASFQENIHSILHAQQLPAVINLGDYRWEFNADDDLIMESVGFERLGMAEEHGFVSMTAEQLLQLARQLQAQPNVTHLNLSQHDIPADTIRELSGPIAMLTSLRWLNLSGCFRSSSTSHPSSSSSPSSLSSSSALSSSDSSDCESESSTDCACPELISFLASSLSLLTRLQRLDLSHNYMGPEGGKVLATSLRFLTELHRLNLRDNYFKTDSGEHIAASLRYLTGLQRLNLNCNYFGEANGEHFAASFRYLTGLQKLEIGDNDFCPSGGLKLAMSLSFLTNLQYLQINPELLGPVQFNDYDENTCCAIAMSLAKLPSFRTLHSSGMSLYPQGIIESGYWQRAGLAVPPDEVISGGWDSVIKFLQAGPCVSLHELRLMLIGDGEVGKTSLALAFHASDHKAKWIPKDQRTVGVDVDIRPLQFAAKDCPTITCQVCDFAGQEIYYLSHTLHFTRRCLYVLMWTTHKFSDEGAPEVLAVAEIVGPLKRWLQLLAGNVPEAHVLVVGTHCSVDPGAFKAMQTLVDQHVQEEIERLCFVADEDAQATRKLVDLQKKKVEQAYGAVRSEMSTSSIKFDDQYLYCVTTNFGCVYLNRVVLDHQKFYNTLINQNPKPRRSLLRKAQTLLQAYQELARMSLRLSRLHAVYDGSEPKETSSVAHLTLVNHRSFAVDSVEGVGVAELLKSIETTCRDKDSLPFMGEQVPLSWLQVKDALKKEKVRKCVGDCVISVQDAAVKVRSALHQTGQNAYLDDDNKIENQEDRDDEEDGDDEGSNGDDGDADQLGMALILDDRGIQNGLEFWSLLGRVFVYDGYFLRDPWIVIELIKPLVHHNVTNRKFRQDFCTGSFASMSDCLYELQNDDVLDLRLLPHFRSWADASPEARSSMLSFLKDCFMISDLSRASTPCVESNLVIARLSRSSDRQRRISAQAVAIEAAAEFFAVFAIPFAHIGLIAHINATVQALQPSQNHLDVSCSCDHVCIGFEGGSRLSCCLSLRSLEDVFRSQKLGSLIENEKVPLDTFSHALVVCGNDVGLFSFAARCVDAIIHSCAFSAHFQCWLPVVRLNAQTESRVDWIPAGNDWVQLETERNKLRLSQMLCSNSDSEVISTPRMKLRDVFPRRPPIYISHSSGDGTGEFCNRLKVKLQERLVCSVWFDRDELGCSANIADLMKLGVANASVFVICLSPLYLTRPTCLRELMWAMDSCENDKSKRLCILPLHPCVSDAGCSSIIQLHDSGCLAEVILPTNDRNPPSHLTLLHQIKGHKLSDHAIKLLRHLTGLQNIGTNVEWLKLQPWLSDTEGESWEEVSQCWYGPNEGKSVDMSTCFDNLALDIQSAVLGSRRACPMELLVEIGDDELWSLPRSQEHLEIPDTALLRSCFPLMLSVFSENDAVRLMTLGLRDVHVIGCIEHGLTQTSTLTSEHNPVHQVFRMAAHMSGVDFDAATRRIKKINQNYALSRLFLELEQLLLIIWSPKRDPDKVYDPFDSCSIISDKDILECIEAGEMCGAMTHIDCSLDLNAVFAQAKQKLTEAKKNDFKLFAAAFFANSAEVDPHPGILSNRESFFRWLMGNLETHVVCRVEGTDDVLLVDALMDWSRHVIRSPPVAWNDFSYKAKASTSRIEMQIRLGNISEMEPHHRTGVFAFKMDGSIHAWNERISSLFRDATYRWIDVLDGDLKVPVCALSPCFKSSLGVYSCGWQSRGIENMLLHPTCALWFVQNKNLVASHAYREIFQTISSNFFGSSGVGPHTIIAAAKKAGPGWMDWHKVTFEQSKDSEHRGMIEFLQRVVNAVLAASNSVASLILVLFEFFSEVHPVSDSVTEKEQKHIIAQLIPKYAKIFGLISKGLTDIGVFRRDLQQICEINSEQEHRSKAIWCLEEALMDNEQAMTLLCQKKDLPSRVPKEARKAFWERIKTPAFFIFAFPRFLCFMNSLCCVNGIDVQVKAASRSTLMTAFHVLCGIPFGMAFDKHLGHYGLNSILFKSQTATPCAGYVPRSQGDPKLPRSLCDTCICCEQRHECHVLKYDGRGTSAEEVEFTRIACRVGSMGWDSHPLMELIHGEGSTHLGGHSGFSQPSILASQSIYRQHLHQHVFDSHPCHSDFTACEHCSSKSLAFISLPDSVCSEVQRLQQERREEFQWLIDAIDRHFSPRSPSE